MAEKRRGERVARQLQAELAALISGELDDPRVGTVSVTGIQLSRDLLSARVYVHTQDDRKGRAELLAGLESARGFLRRQLSQRLSHLRRIPELTFAYDTSLDRAMRVEEILARIDRNQ